MAANVERCPACGVALSEHPYCILCRCYVHTALVCGRDQAICTTCDAALARRSLRRCKKCEAVRPSADFPARSRECRTCKRARDRANKARNKEHTAALNKAWNERNADRHRAYKQAWAQRNREKVLAKKRRYNARHRVALRKAARERYAMNREQHRASNRASWQRNREKYAARKREKYREQKLAILKQIQEAL